MNKKKIALTILLSALLSLLVAFCILEFSKKPKLIETPSVTENKIQTEIPQNDKINVTTPKNKALPVKNNKPVNVAKPPKVQNTPVVQIKQPETVSNVLEEKVEDNVVTQEEGVVIPVNYVSKNTYKYTYTPKRYNRK